jgi:hypothetical protein
MSSNLLTLSTDTTVFPWANRTPIDGLRATIAIALALLIGQLAGHTSAGAIAAGSAFTVGFAIFHETLSSALLSMAILTLGLASATLAGSLAAEWTPLVLFVTLIAAVNYGLLSGLSATAGWMGQQCATYVVISCYFPKGLHYAIGRTEMVLAGGALQMLVFTAFYFLRHPAVEATAPPLHHRLKRRTAELWKKLRDESHFQGDTLSYILRLAVTLLLCTFIYRRFHVRNGYWSPMTALLVLKQQWIHTVSRSIARLVGTLIGAGIALLLARTVTLDHFAIVIGVLLCAWACFALQAVNYAAFSCFITLYIVFLFRSGGFSQTSAAHIRLFNTALGGCIALLIDAAWKLFTPAPQPVPQSVASRS